MNQEVICPNPHCRQPVGGSRACPACGLPVHDTEFFRPYTWKDLRGYLCVITVMAGICYCMLHGDSPTWMRTIGTIAGIVCFVAILGAAKFAFWLLLATGSRILYAVSPSGIHAIPYAKGASTRTIPWYEVAGINGLKEHGLVTRIEVKLRSGASFTLNDVEHDVNRMHRVISNHIQISNMASGVH